jgi:hypothetical protein
MSAKESADSYAAYVARRKELDAAVKKRYFGPRYDYDGNKIKTDFAPLISLFKEFELHYEYRCEFEDDEFELLKKMLDVEEDNEKLEDIMNEVFALHHPAFDWRDENTW